jgi:hypothetical protein
MNTSETVNIQRRRFLSSSSLLLLGAASLNAAPFQSPSTPKGPDLPEALSAEELTRIKDSVMSEDLQNFWHKGYS